jgi:predicted RNase H-like HicB family nuclease
MHKYRIQIYWSAEDQVFIAKVPELPGCMTHGDTRAEARANANEAIQSWINTANEFGDPIPGPKRERGTSNRLAEDKYRIMSRRRSSIRSNNPLSIFRPKAPHLTMNPKAQQNLRG